MSQQEVVRPLKTFEETIEWAQKPKEETNDSDFKIFYFMFAGIAGLIILWFMIMHFTKDNNKNNEEDNFFATKVEPNEEAKHEDKKE